MRQTSVPARFTFGHPDAEELALELEQLKKKFSAVKDDNVFLRTQIQRLNSLLRKKDKHIQQVLEIKVNTISDQTTSTQFTAKLKALKSEMVAISRLSAKNRDLEHDLLKKDEELKLLKASMKFTLIKELQIEAQTFFNEARRMKKMLDARAGSIVKRSAWDGDEDKAESRERDFEREERLQEERESKARLHKLREKMESLQDEMRDCTEQVNTLERLSPSSKPRASIQFRSSSRIPISAPVADKQTEDNFEDTYDEEPSGTGNSGIYGLENAMGRPTSSSTNYKTSIDANDGDDFLKGF